MIRLFLFGLAGFILSSVAVAQEGPFYEAATLEMQWNGSEDCVLRDIDYTKVGNVVALSLAETTVCNTTQVPFTTTNALPGYLIPEREVWTIMESGRDSGVAARGVLFVQTDGFLRYEVHNSTNVEVIEDPSTSSSRGMNQEMNSLVYLVAPTGVIGESEE